jgi:hypothetical protein
MDDELLEAHLADLGIPIDVKPPHVTRGQIDAIDREVRERALLLMTSLHLPPLPADVRELAQAAEALSAFRGLAARAIAEQLVLGEAGLRDPELIDAWWSRLLARMEQPR